ncbi:hypothetical protein [Streptomyces sp. LX-29]|nr:hypothetical protein [Streptomyces sp. LX-29]
MANLLYQRVTTDERSTDRQNLVLDEAGMVRISVVTGPPGAA